MRALSTVLLLAALASPAAAGWLVERSSRTEGASGPATTVTLLIARGRVKELHQDSTYFLWDLRRHTLFQVDPAAKTYSGGPIPQVIASVKAYLDRMRQEISRMSEGQREELARRSEGMPMPVPPPATPPAWTVKATNKTATLAGQSCKLYEIYRDGTLFEQRWIAEKVAFGDDLDHRAFARWSDELEGTFASGMGDAMPSGGEVTALAAKGFAMRNVYLGARVRVVNEVVRIERREVPDSTFTLPVDYTVKGGQKS